MSSLSGTVIHPAGLVSACNCIGPQEGQPLCPCQMRHVQIVDGRYVRITDLGPVREKLSEPVKDILREVGLTL